VFEEFGLHCEQGDNPFPFAWEMRIDSETFFTYLQVEVWYFSPEGVLYTVCAQQNVELNTNKKNTYFPIFPKNKK